ncbi:hypothetical protein ABEB36_009599 [Hypothenemus hampei]|uniref:Uncharacterized protein n=1 Tax=Hypothenemus hampei TaxID=57062 RepID=A0ABD1EGU7_HYPHA
MGVSVPTVKRIKPEFSELSFYYPTEIEDDVEHTIIICPRWVKLRRQLELRVDSTLTIENIGEVMLRSKSNWVCDKFVCNSVKMVAKALNARSTDTCEAETANTVLERPYKSLSVCLNFFQ